LRKAIAAVLVAVLLASVPLLGCGRILKGSGNLKTKEYTFVDFTSVEISSAFEFHISQASSYKVSITADDNVFEKLEIIKEGNTLKIALKPMITLGSATLEAEVTMPQLHGLAVSGASRGTVSDFYSAENLDLNVSGASKVTGDITAGDADFTVSGASTVQLEGSANDIVANVRGGSRFKLGGFIVNNASVTFSSASTGTVNVSGKLDANLSSASKLSYLGEPTIGNINISGASSFNKKYF